VIPRVPARETVKLCLEAEALGFGGVWVADSQSVFRDAFTILGAVAGQTERLLLSAGVTNPVTRHIAVLAGTHGTLAELAPGRVIIALGRGESAVRTIGLRPATLVRMETAVHSLRALLTGETTTWDGAEIRLGWQACPVPIYVTASGPKTLRLAGRVADGVLFQSGAAPELIEWALAQIQAGAQEAGRDISDLTMCARVGCCVDSDADVARDRMRPYAASAAKTVFDSAPPDVLQPELVRDVVALKEAYDYYEQAQFDAAHSELLTSEIIDAVAITGSPDRVAERISRLASFGIDRIVLTYAGLDARAQSRLLAETLMLKGSA
jgi:5,10-methylenetetrahydromethanopterin reductase